MCGRSYVCVRARARRCVCVWCVCVSACMYMCRRMYVCVRVCERASTKLTRYRLFANPQNAINTRYYQYFFNADGPDIIVDGTCSSIDHIYILQHLLIDIYHMMRKRRCDDVHK
jgi:hypothetical protein